MSKRHFSLLVGIALACLLPVLFLSWNLYCYQDLPLGEKIKTTLYAIAGIPIIVTLLGKPLLSLTDFLGVKMIPKLKRFTQETAGDLFLSGIYGQELGYYAELAEEGIVYLFAMIIRTTDTGSNQGEKVVQNYIRKRFHSSQRQGFFSNDEAYMKKKLSQYLRREKLSDYRTACLNIVKSKISYEARIEFFEQLFQVAQANGKPQEKTWKLLSEIAKFLLITEWDLTTLAYKYQYRHAEQRQIASPDLESSMIDRFFQKLGLERNATEGEIKNAYRNIVKQCHPDKLTEETDEKKREDAIILFRQATEAYQEICKIKEIS